jgi:hypothetical protein
MQKKLRMKEIEHNAFVVVAEPKPGMARMLALTTMMMIACRSSLSGKHSHLSLRHSTYQGRLGFGLYTEIVHKSLHIHPTYETIDIDTSEAFKHHCWNPKHDDCNTSHERSFWVFAPLAQ